MLLSENSDFIDNLFGSNVHYRVPRYQRRYVWDETNWDTLWNDILSQLDGEDKPTHFTGPIVTRSIDSKRAYEVIDGQQRLATFQIILCIIRDLSQTQDDDLDKLAHAAAKYVVNDPDVLIDNPKYEFTFIPTDYDQKAFSQVTSGDYAQHKENNDRHGILNAYNYFAYRIQEYVGENPNFDKMRRLLRSITDGFSFIHITLDASNQPEKIFESINATGRKLSEFDYLRNHLFLRAGDDAERFYQEHWDFEGAEHHWNENRLKSFLRAFLMAKLGPVCFEKNAKPFEVYQQYSKALTVERGIKYEFQQLSAYATAYRTINDREINTRCSRLCKILNLPSLDPFILFITFILDCNEDIVLVCHILESYIVRRLFCCNDAEDSYQIINDFFSKAIKTESFNVQDFTKTLAKTWPNNKRVEDSFRDTNSKDSTLIGYIFDELRLWEKTRRDLLNMDTDQRLLEDMKEILDHLEEISISPDLFNRTCQRFTEIWGPSDYFIS